MCQLQGTSACTPPVLCQVSLRPLHAAGPCYLCCVLCRCCGRQQGAHQEGKQVVSPSDTTTAQVFQRMAAQVRMKACKHNKLGYSSNFHVASIWPSIRHIKAVCSGLCMCAWKTTTCMVQHSDFAGLLVYDLWECFVHSTAVCYRSAARPTTLEAA